MPTVRQSSVTSTPTPRPPRLRPDAAVLARPRRVVINDHFAALMITDSDGTAPGRGHGEPGHAAGRSTGRLSNVKRLRRPELPDREPGDGAADDHALDLRGALEGWISEVPAKMVKIFASRCQRSTGYSRVQPLPPRIWIACSVTRTAVFPATSVQMEPSA